MRAFCVVVLTKEGGGRDVFVKEVEPCEARSHMTIDELENFIAGETAYTAVEKCHLVYQVQEIRYTQQASDGVR